VALAVAVAVAVAVALAVAVAVAVAVTVCCRVHACVVTSVVVELSVGRDRVDHRHSDVMVPEWVIDAVCGSLSSGGGISVGRTRRSVCLC
jgi:hypothetical protein